MKCRMIFAACLLPLVFAFGIAWAQGTVVEAVDEDIIEEVKSATVEDTAAAVDTVAVKDVPAKKDALDLDALLVVDEEDDLLIGDRPTVKQAAADSVAAGSSSAESADKIDDADKGKVADADSAARSDSAAVRVAEIKVESVGRESVVVEDGREVNFAHNLKEYRSPRRAMLMSLLVPGLGQAYARNYIKAGAFGAAELTAIGVAIYFNTVAKSKKKDAYKFADDNFDVELLREYDRDLRREFETREIDIEDIVRELPLDYYDNDFYDAVDKKQTYYYESIRGGMFAPGWTDNRLSLEDILSLSNGTAADDTLRTASGKYVLSDPTTPAFFYEMIRVVNSAGRVVNEGPMIGYSPNQAKYNSMIKDANSYHDAVTYTLYVLLLNHIASAIDAGFTARAYNNRLLMGQESVWERITVEQQFVFTGSEVSPGLALRVRF